VVGVKQSIVYATVLATLSTVFYASAAGAGASDTQGPQLVSMSVAPDRVDVSGSAASVIVSAVITDDLSGFSSGYVSVSPLGQQVAGGGFSSVGGDSFQATVTIPQYAAQGVWRGWSVYLTDMVGNYTSLSEDDLLARGINLAVGVGTWESSYSRWIKLRGSSGSVRSDDGSRLCSAYVPVILYHREKSGWELVGRTYTYRSGYFRFKDAPRRGRFRVVAPRFGLGTPPLATCLKASEVTPTSPAPRGSA
jgi:hypothetical protein